MGKPGRPKGSDNKEKICSLRLDEQTLKRLNAYCEPESGKVRGDPGGNRADFGGRSV